jgi:hypothetical protein
VTLGICAPDAQARMANNRAKAAGSAAFFAAQIIAQNRNREDQRKTIGFERARLRNEQ